AVPAAEGSVPKNDARRNGGLGENRTPGTWALLHGPGDCLEALEEPAFRLMARVLDSFADLRIPRVRRLR
ncbi:MAG TPA: hypothetical protein VLH39_01585, partial [Magnetospirillaceae bacterium]|nr:hypothetical protein [Magnetospirillaceae bacterium]